MEEIRVERHTLHFGKNKSRTTLGYCNGEDEDRRERERERRQQTQRRNKESAGDLNETERGYAGGENIEERESVTGREKKERDYRWRR